MVGPELHGAPVLLTRCQHGRGGCDGTHCTCPVPFGGGFRGRGTACTSGVFAAVAAGSARLAAGSPARVSGRGELPPQHQDREALRRALGHRRRGVPLRRADPLRTQGSRARLHAPAWAQNREALWNPAEARETRANSVTVGEWELALPAEGQVLVMGFARELVARYGLADVAIHAPHRDGDQRNHHAHVLTTTRVLTAEGLTDKTRGPEIEAMRARWAELQNAALERQGHEVRVDHRSLAVQREATLAQGHELRAEELDRGARGQARAGRLRDRAAGDAGGRAGAAALRARRSPNCHFFLPFSLSGAWLRADPATDFTGFELPLLAKSFPAFEATPFEVFSLLAINASLKQPWEAYAARSR